MIFCCPGPVAPSLGSRRDVFLGPGKQYPLSPRGPDRVSRAGHAPARGGVATTISNETAQLLRVRSADGTAIAAYRSGTGSPLVLVHGVSSDRTRWQPVLPALERAHTVYAMDRRGRGGSGDGSTYTIEREFEDVAALVNAIPQPVALLGHSFGAAVALRAALLTSTVQTLLLYEGGGKPKGVISFAPAFIERIEALLAAGERDRLVATFLRDAVGMSPEEVERMRALPAYRGRLAAAHTIPREMRALNDYWFDAERYRAFAPPTLVMVGGASPPQAHAYAQALASALPSARVEVLEGQHHNATDTAPRLFAETVLRFVAEAEGRRQRKLPIETAAP